MMFLHEIQISQDKLVCFLQLRIEKGKEKTVHATDTATLRYWEGYVEALKGVLLALEDSKPK